MTQRECAEKSIVTPEMKATAEEEGVEPGFILRGLAEGSIVLPANPGHQGLDPCAIGRGLRTKVNANIGTSSDSSSLETELEKLAAAQEYGADTVMDLSTGGDIPAIRRAILARSRLALGTVPIYQAAVVAIEKHGAIVKMGAEDMFDAIESHARDGADFITVHCGVNIKTIDRLRGEGRLADIVSRGGLS